MYEGYELIRIEIDAGVAVARIDNPPVNVMTIPLFAELIRLGEQIAADDAVRVLVLRSANPEFFIAHFDVEALLALPVDGPVQRPEQLNGFHRMCECLRQMPKVTIAQIDGRVGGGGSELVAACDLRYGVLGRTVISQMEVCLGILPGGGGTQRLPRLLGRGRALELILGGGDLDAETAERWGYLDRALPADEIEGFVDALAGRMARFSEPALRSAKAAVDAAERPLCEGLLDETVLFEQLLRSPEARERMQRFLDLGGQTLEGEREIQRLCDRINPAP